MYLIFDMDGVLVDSNPFHKQAWQSFSTQLGCAITEEVLEKSVYGKTNRDALTFLLNRELSAQETQQFADEKEALYRELFKPHLQPVTGLNAFLDQMQHERVFESLAIATSAPPDNVDFVLDGLSLRSYFSIIVDETMVTRGKPDPEIYLKTAERLHAKPDECWVIEDSYSGIESARQAGMRVIGITTTHSAEELSPRVHCVISDFNELAEKRPFLTAKSVG